MRGKRRKEAGVSRRTRREGGMEEEGEGENRRRKRRAGEESKERADEKEEKRIEASGRTVGEKRKDTESKVMRGRKV